MIRNLNYQNNKNTLYIIPTPIGNLEDITLRSINILKMVDKIYAEDTRVSMKLLSHYDIKKPIESMHEFNETSKTDSIIRDLDSGLNIGIISDAGMPLISDPGFEVVRAALDKGYNVVALPGPNALIPALVMSGIKTHPFMFYGFLSSKSQKRKKEIAALKYRTDTMIFYEAIHRISQTLSDLYDILGDRNFVIAREISKSYEEIIKGSLKEHKEVGDLKGELVIIIDGYTETETNNIVSIVNQVDYFIKQGFKKTDAMKQVSEMTGIPKNTIYQEYLDKKINKG